MSRADHAAQVAAHRAVLQAPEGIDRRVAAGRLNLSVIPAGLQTILYVERSFGGTRRCVKQLVD